MWSYPNLVPLPESEVLAIAAAVEPFEFDTIHGAWWERIMPSGAKQIVMRSAERYGRALRGELPGLSSTRAARTDPAAAQARDQRVAHRDGRRDLAGARRQLVEGQAERRLGEHLRGLAVARVAAGDLGHDAPAAALAGEADVEPGALAPLGRRPVAGLGPAEQPGPRRRQLREREHRAQRAGRAERDRQLLDGRVVPVGEVGPVALERRRRALDDLRVERRQRQRPGAERALVARVVPDRGDPPLRPRLDAAAREMRRAGLAHAPERVDGGVERARRRPAADAHEAAHHQRDVLRQLLHGEERAEIVRDRVEAAGMDQPRAASRRPRRGGARTSGRRTRARRSGRRSRCPHARRRRRAARRSAGTARPSSRPRGPTPRSRAASRRRRRRRAAARAARTRGRSRPAARARPRACRGCARRAPSACPAGALRARYSAVSPPANPVAPWSTMSSRRRSGMLD